MPKGKGYGGKKDVGMGGMGMKSGNSVNTGTGKSMSMDMGKNAMGMGMNVGKPIGDTGMKGGNKRTKQVSDRYK